MLMTGGVLRHRKRDSTGYGHAMTDDELAAIVAKAKLTLVKILLSQYVHLLGLRPVTLHLGVSDHVSEWLSQRVLDKVHLC